MVKSESREKLSERQKFWLKIAEDATEKLKAAKGRVTQLEMALAGFRRNAENDVPIPGEASTHN